MTSFQKNLKLQLILTVILVAAFAFQFKVINPVENELFPSIDLRHASLLFIPHGLKILIAYLLGVVALPAIFFAQLIAGFYILGAAPVDALVGASFGTIAVGGSVAMINFLFKNKWYEGVALHDNGGIGTFRAFIIAVIISTFINSLLHSAYYHVESTIMLPFRYLFGDIMGSILIFTLVMLLRRQILSFIARRISA